MTNRTVFVERETEETSIELRLNLDGQGVSDISTGIGFFDHMLTALVKHSSIDLVLRCSGDLVVDDHHTVEDCGLTLGQAFQKALGNKAGIARFGFVYAPLDEALARAVIDFSGRGCAVTQLCLKRELLGTLSTENISHFFHSFASTGQFAIHVDVLRGENDHHRAEAAFKACALAIRKAIKCDGTQNIPSTKGVI